jgi:hypothetical protein
VAGRGQLLGSAFTNSWRTSAGTTAAPGSAKARAVASPMPEAVPVTSATFPLTSNMLLIMFAASFFFPTRFLRIHLFETRPTSLESRTAMTSLVISSASWRFYLSDFPRP